ncbi:hypothetical protein GCM10009736_37940 [Actinomadura bangladeshensis]
MHRANLSCASSAESDALAEADAEAFAPPPAEATPLPPSSPPQAEGPKTNGKASPTAHTRFPISSSPPRHPASTKSHKTDPRVKPALAALALTGSDQVGGTSPEAPLTSKNVRRSRGESEHVEPHWLHTLAPVAPEPRGVAHVQIKEDTMTVVLDGKAIATGTPTDCG